MDTNKYQQNEQSSESIQPNIDNRKYNAQLYFNKQLKESKKILIISVIVTIISGFIAYRFYIVGEANQFEIFISILICLISTCFDLGIIFRDFPRLKRIIKLIDNDIDEVELIMLKEKKAQEEAKNRQEEFQAQQAEMQERKNAIEHPECPMCKSRNTKRISTINRTASVATLGLASSKIGKQFECLNCKYKW